MLHTAIWILVSLLRLVAILALFGLAAGAVAWSVSRRVGNDSVVFVNKQRPAGQPPQLFIEIISVILLLGGLTVIPLGNWSITISELHPALANFQIYQIAPGQYSLLFLPVLVVLALVINSGFRAGLISTNLPELRLFAGLLLAALSVLSVLISTGTIDTGEILFFQNDHGWLLLHNPLSAVGFFSASYLLIDRRWLSLPGITFPPQNLVELRELFSSLKLGLALVLLAALFSLIYLGGAAVPLFGLLRDTASVGLSGRFGLLLQPVVLFLKIFALISLFVWLKLIQPGLPEKRLLSLIFSLGLPVLLIDLVVAATARTGVAPGSSGWWLLRGVWTVIGFGWVWYKSFYLYSGTTIKLVEP